MTLTSEDRQLLIKTLNQEYENRIPRGPLGIRDKIAESLIRSRMPPLPQVLSKIPLSLERYTLKEIKEGLLDAYYKGELVLP